MATQTATISISASVAAVRGGRSTTAGLSSAPKRILGNGTTANNADLGFYDSNTVASTGSPTNLDLAGGGLIDINGQPLTLVDVTTLIFANLGDTISIAVGGGSNYFDFGCGANTKTFKPGERGVLIDLGTDPGYPVTAGTGDILKIAIASGTLAAYEILIVGRSA